MRLLILSAAVAAACNAVPAGAASPILGVEFTSTPAPSNEQEALVERTTSSAIVTYSNGDMKAFPLEYRTLYSSGDSFGGWSAGTIVDRAGKALESAVIDEKGTTARGPFHARSPDANSLFRQGKAIHLITHFEYDTDAENAEPGKPPVNLYARLPMTMNLATLKQDASSGMLSVGAMSNVDMSRVGGLWIPCAGELTAWNTHLGGEEYEPDARSFESRPLTAMNLYLGTPGKTASQGGANPYRYGLMTEVKVLPGGRTKVAKHYAMGRLANELAHVLPDGRTAYKGDDGRDVILSMFVADRRGDLSAGTLYAARLKQLDGAGTGKFAVEWIRLGHASDREIEALIAGGIRFSDIFESATAAEFAADPARYAGFRPVFVYTGTAGTHSNRLEYLKVRAGREKAAAFLETRRYAALRGATTEFTKMEGETSNAKDRKLYIAMSYIELGMLAGKNGDRPRDDIALAGDPGDLACGAVYESRLRGGRKDTSGRRIRSQWVALDMQAIVAGGRKPADQTAYGRYDKCDTDRPANPDNIKYSAALRTLFIGEDSGNHMNNFLWAYGVDSGKLARIASARMGAEWTGLQVVENLGGHAYIMANQQHPGAAEDTEQYRKLLQRDGVDLDALRRRIDQRGSVGYLGGIPALGRAH